jgi:ribosomal protein L7Ae-like RNA K-turn-binding protein
MSKNKHENENQQKILTYIRLARRSGDLIAGFDACVNESRKGNLELIIATKDISEGSMRNLKNKCNEKSIIIIFEHSSILNKETGLSNKKVFGIRNENLANAIKKYYELYRKS